MRTQGTGTARSTPWDSGWEGGRDLPSCPQFREVLGEAHLGCGTCQDLEEPSIYPRAPLSSREARRVEVQAEPRGPSCRPGPGRSVGSQWALPAVDGDQTHSVWPLPCGAAGRSCSRLDVYVPKNVHVEP